MADVNLNQHIFKSLLFPYWNLLLLLVKISLASGSRRQRPPMLSEEKPGYVLSSDVWVTGGNNVCG